MGVGVQSISTFLYFVYDNLTWAAKYQLIRQDANRMVQRSGLFWMLSLLFQIAVDLWNYLVLQQQSVKLITAQTVDLEGVKKLEAKVRTHNPPRGREGGEGAHEGGNGELALSPLTGWWGDKCAIAVRTAFELAQKPVRCSHRGQWRIQGQTEHDDHGFPGSDLVVGRSVPAVPGSQVGHRTTVVLSRFTIFLFCSCVHSSRQYTAVCSLRDRNGGWWQW